MTRPLRIEFENAVYHVTARGIERRDIVVDDKDRTKWIEYLAQACERHGVVVYAFALMDNHYHLFVRTPQANLSRAVHDLNASYAGWFNRRHGRVGHLLAGRFKAILVDSEGYYWAVSRYIHLNPVRAGMAKRPEDYKWSSYRGYQWPSRKLAWVAYDEVLGEAGKAGTVYAKYREFVRAGVKVPPESPFARVVGGLLLGREKFVNEIKRLLGARVEGREVQARRKLRTRPAFERICEVVCGEYGTDPSEVNKKRKRGNAAKQAAV
ncbi:MAG: transposase, partial [Planctomycetota bacterium]|nr:transposase [Planctomycetota bacterium]